MKLSNLFEKWLKESFGCWWRYLFPFWDKWWALFTHLFLAPSRFHFFSSSKEVNWLKVAPRLPPPFILILWLYTKARKAIRTINGHQFQLHIHLSAISSLAFAARARVVVVMVRIRKQSRGMHHFLSSPNYLSHFSCSHQQVGTLFLLRIVVLCDMKTRKTRLINLQFFVLPPTLYFCSSILAENCGGEKVKGFSYVQYYTHA